VRGKKVYTDQDRELWKEKHLKDEREKVRKA
jgi:hypothetical protein